MALVGAQFVNAVSPNPVGSLQAYAGASAPTGWLLCDGTSYSTSVYPELFSVLGYTYGGSSGNFNVPDLRGRVVVGKGSHVDVDALGDNDGSALANRRPKHQHTVYDPGHSHTHNGTAAANFAGSGGLQGTQSTVAMTINNNTTGIKVNPEGSGSSSAPQDGPAYLVTNYIIKAVPDAPRSGLAYGSTPPIVTQLPGNPQFGDVVTYIADATNGVAWNLQYDATGTYPWKFIGGAPWMENAAGGTLAGATPSYSLLTGYTVALPGDYMVTIEVGFALATSASATYVEMGPVLNSEAFDYPKVSSFYCAAANIGGPMVKTRRITVASSGGVLRGIFQPNPAQGSFNRITETVTPVRVKAA